MRRSLLVSLHALFLGGSLAFGQGAMPNSVPASATPQALDLAAVQCADKTETKGSQAATGDGCCGHGGACGCGPVHDGCCCQDHDTWTGFYLGVETGVGIGVETTSLDSSVTSTPLGTNGLVSSTGRAAATDWTLAGDIGFNRQFSSLVVGVESDWQWTIHQDATTASTPASSTLAFFGAGANGFGYALLDEHKLYNPGTIRARAGLLVNDNNLLYVTGGGAWGTVKDNLSFRGSATPAIFPGALQPGPFLNADSTVSETKWGWALGAGMETRLSAHWSLKVEYLFLNLGTVQQTMPIRVNPNPIFSPPGGGGFTGATATASSNWLATEHLIHVGLNYRF